MRSPGTTFVTPSPTASTMPPFDAGNGGKTGHRIGAAAMIDIDEVDRPHDVAAGFRRDRGALRRWLSRSAHRHCRGRGFRSGYPCHHSFDLNGRSTKPDSVFGMRSCFRREFHRIEREKIHDFFSSHGRKRTDDGLAVCAIFCSGLDGSLRGRRGYCTSSTPPSPVSRRLKKPWDSGSSTGAGGN